MCSAASNPEILAMARHAIDHARQGTMALADGICRVPAENYTCPERYQREMRRIFRRLPFMLAPSVELPNPGDFKTLEVAGVPVLLLRDQGGVIRALLNSCSHRGANVATRPCGNARRFTCPYHGWTFGQKGELLAVSSAVDFGDLDKGNHGLTSLPVAERAGLIFGCLDPHSTLNIDTFLAGYDKVLDGFNFKNWHYFSSRMVKGPNWKIAYDGYLDFYHLPVLHRESFGPVMSNRAHYHAWGPHQRLIAPDKPILDLAANPESEWSDFELMRGVWTIFPSVSISGFDNGGWGVLISQLLPGEHVGESWTRQIYLMEHAPTGEQAEAAEAQFAFLEQVVRDEDYLTGTRQQQALAAGARSQVLFGRNEGGAHRFHSWVDRLLAAEDSDLEGIFAAEG